MKRFIMLVIALCLITVTAQIAPAATVESAAIGYPATIETGTAWTIECKEGAVAKTEAILDIAKLDINADQVAQITKKNESVDTSIPTAIAMAESVLRDSLPLIGASIASERMQAYTLTVKPLTMEGTIPRELTGRFTGTAQIIGSEIVITDTYKNVAGVFASI